MVSRDRAMHGPAEWLGASCGQISGAGLGLAFLYVVDPVTDFLKLSNCWGNGKIADWQCDD
jgi:hypothetical protein